MTGVGNINDIYQLGIVLNRKIELFQSLEHLSSAATILVESCLFDQIIPFWFQLLSITQQKRERLFSAVLALNLYLNSKNISTRVRNSPMIILGHHFETILHMKIWKTF
eukprot:gb/GECH01008898.1/.p1 GENE.gb/GECH01008898.1/~~gb/GECH01008898.1/.p1  ORF type:complete len:109 (+),score=18.32 gb/GECH01008898.1/:1-327(+)